MRRNDQNSQIEWTVAREIAPGKAQSLDARISTDQNEKYLRGCIGAIFGASFATTAYSIIAVRYEFATQYDRLAGLVAMAIILAGVAGHLNARYRRAN